MAATVIEEESALAPPVINNTADNQTAKEDRETNTNPAWNNDNGVGTARPSEDEVEEQRKKNKKYWEERERENADRAERESRFTEQDRPQFLESEQRKDVRQYKKDVKQNINDMFVYKDDVIQYGIDEAKYKSDLKVWEVEKEKYEKNVQTYHSELTKYQKENTSDSDFQIWKSSTDEKKYEKVQETINIKTKQYENTIKNYEKQDARWYVIPSFSDAGYQQKWNDTFKKYKGWQKKGLTTKIDKKYRELHGTSYLGYYRTYYQNQYQKKYGSKMAHNQKLNEKYGGRPSVSIGNIGILQRTAADIIQGKSNVPLKQTSSSIQRQVKLYYLGQRYKNTSMSLNEFKRAKAAITKSVADKAAAEQARRNWSSAISAKSAAVKATEKHQFMLKEMNKQNRLGQMAAQTAQNAKVNAALSKAGVDAAKLKLSKGTPRPVTMSAPVMTGNQVNAIDNINAPQKPQSAQSIFDIPQSQFAAMQAGRGLTEKFDIGEWQSSNNNQFAKSKPTIDSKQTMAVSPTSLLLVNQRLLQLEAAKIKKEKMQDQPPKPTWTVGDKTFISLKAAEKYAKESGNVNVIPPSLTEFAAEKSVSQGGMILDTGRYDDPFRVMQAGLWNALRYSDAVDSGEKSADKWFGEKDNLLSKLSYYSSTTLKPLTDVALSVSNLVSDTKYTITPSLASTVIDVPLNWATGKPIETTPLDYVKKDPLRTILQLPAEGALWVTGSKLIEVTPKVIQKIAPIRYMNPQIEGKTIYRGIGYADKFKAGKPILGKYSGVSGLQKGYKPELIPWKNIDIAERTGGKLATATGTGQKAFFYSDEALNYQIKTGQINELSRKWAVKARDLFEKTEQTRQPFRPNVGKFDPSEFKHLSTKQAEYSQKWIKMQQKKEAIEAIHGSMVTNVTVPQPVKALTNKSVLKIGDVDVTPRFPKGVKTDAQKSQFADDLLKSYAKDFPLEEGQSFKLGLTKTGKEASNKGFQLITEKGGKMISKEKTFEVVMPKVKTETKMNRLQSLFRQPSGTKQMDVTMPEKVMKVGGMKFSKPQYQRLSQYETAFAHQESKPWSKVMEGEVGLKELSPWQKQLDTPSRARIMPQEGRHGKDTARTYWLALARSKEQSKQIRPILSKQTEEAAQKFKGVHPEVNFGEAGNLGRIEMQTSVKVTTPKPILDLSTRTAPSLIQGSRATVNVIKPVGVGKNKESGIKVKSSKPLTSTTKKPLTSTSSKPLSSTSSKPLTSTIKKPLTSTSSKITLGKSTSSKSSIWRSSSSKRKAIEEKPFSSSYSTTSKRKPKSILSIPSSVKPPSSGGSSSSGRPKPKPKLKIQKVTTPSGVSVFSKPSKVGASIVTANVHDVSDRAVNRKKPVGWYFDNQNKKEKKKGKDYPTHDFLGNMRLDQIEGQFRRKEVIHGDKRTHKQVKKDKTKGFNELSVRIF